MAQKSKKSLQDRAFIQTLSALSPAELKAFKAFCDQSLSITEKTKGLFKAIYEVAPDYGKLPEEKIFSLFSQDRPTAKAQLNYALHDLNELLRKWLVQIELEADGYLQNQLFIRACQKRFLHPQFFKKTHHTLDALKKDYLAVPDTWQKQYETNFQLFFHSQTSKNHEFIESLEAMESNLELSYQGAKLRLLCQKVLRKKVLATLPELEEASIKATLDFANAHQDNIPFFNLYFQFIQYLRKPNKIDLKNFIQDFKSDRTKLERLDQCILLFAAAYSLNGLTMKGDKPAVQIQFDLFKYAFENDLVLFDNEIGSVFFNNFCVAACEMKSFEIAKKMLKKYEAYFAPTIREEFTNLMWCTIFYFERKYEKVELQLHAFQFKLPSLRIRSRNLLLKSLYERLRNDESQKALILSELVKLRKYIQKQNTLPEHRKNMYYDMISVIRRLTNVAHKHSLYREKAKQELMVFLNDKTKKPLSRKWLLEKVQEL